MMKTIDISRNSEAYLYVLDNYRAGELNLTEAMILLRDHCDMSEEVAAEILTTEKLSLIHI